MKASRHGSSLPLQWRHNGHDGVSNHQPHDCLLSRLFRRRSKKKTKLRVTGLYVMFPFDDVIMSHYYSFWRVHRLPLDFSHGKLVIWNIDVSFVVSMKKLLNEQSTCRKFEMPLCSFKVTVISFVPFILRRRKMRPSACVHRQQISVVQCPTWSPKSRAINAISPSWDRKGKTKNKN